MAMKLNSSNVTSLLNDSTNYNEHTNISSQFLLFLPCNSADRFDRKYPLHIYIHSTSTQ